MSTPEGPIRPQPKSSVNPEAPGKSIAAMVQNLQQVEDAEQTIRQKAEAALHEKREEAKAYGTKLVAMAHDAIVNFLGEAVSEILPHLRWERTMKPTIDVNNVREDVMVFTLDILDEKGGLRPDAGFSREVLELLFAAAERQDALQNFVESEITLIAAESPLNADFTKTKLLYYFVVPYDYIGKVHLNREPASRNHMKTVADVSVVDAAGKVFRKEMAAVLDKGEAESVGAASDRALEIGSPSAVLEAVASMRPARKPSPFLDTVLGGMKAAPAHELPDDDSEAVTLDGSEISARK